MAEEKINSPLQYSLKDLGKDLKNEHESIKETIKLRSARKKEIATRIKALRKKNKLTQKDVSDKIEINPLTYSNYEIERSDISVEVLIRLADLYNVSMDYMTCRTDNPKGIYFAVDDGIENKSETEDNNDMEARIAKLEEAIEKLKSI